MTALFGIFLETNKHQNLMRPRHPIVRPSTCSTIPPLMLPRRPFDVVGNGQGASDDAVEDADDVHTAVILWRERSCSPWSEDGDKERAQEAKVALLSG